MQTLGPALLERANLYYGSRAIPVTPHETRPLPPVFDFDNAEQCARLILAIMSDASGGHPMYNCCVWLHAGDNYTANITADGAHVFYSVANRPKYTVDQALARMQTRRVLTLGAVVANNYLYPHWCPVGPMQNVRRRAY